MAFSRRYSILPRLDAGVHYWSGDSPIFVSVILSDSAYSANKAAVSIISDSESFRLLSVSLSHIHYIVYGSICRWKLNVY